MRLKLSLRRPAPASTAARPIWFVLLALLLFVASLLAGFYLAFPQDLLQRRVVAEINRRLPPGNRFAADRVTLGLPLRLQFTGARLSLEAPNVPDLEFSELALVPTLASLVGDPGLSVMADSSFGLLSGALQASGAVDLHLVQGRIDQPLPGLGQTRLAGRIEAIDLVGQLQIERDEPLRLAVVVDELQLAGAKGFGLGSDQLPLGRFELVLGGRGRALQVERLALGGGQLELSGNGSLLLQQPLPASRIDLDLQLRPTSAADPALKGLLELLGSPGRDGARSLQLGGRLLAPQLK